MNRCHVVMLLASFVVVACGVGFPGKSGPSPETVIGSVRDGVAEPGMAEIDYTTDVKPILDSRCVACHACYDAPCQLKATAPEGLERGASRARVYHSTRLLPADPTRLFVDEQTTTGLYRTNECPTSTEFDSYARRHPEGGMPYALPALSDAERESLYRWLDAGAPFESRARPAHEFRKPVRRWETFFNRIGTTQRSSSGCSGNPRQTPHGSSTILCSSASTTCW